jgi:dGTP triphosphohydrolase
MLRDISITGLLFVILISSNIKGVEMSEVSLEQKMHHYMGIEMNIQTWNLLEKEDRNEQDDARMVNFAQASLYHWRKSHKYEPVNEQRGQWMLSRVYAGLSNGKEALSYANEASRLTNEQNLKDFDLAYSYEALARANAALGNKKECVQWLEKAQEAGTLIQSEEDKKYFISDLESAPWFDCK